MAWREHLASPLTNVARTPAVKVSTHIRPQNPTSWRTHAALGHVYAHVIANHVGSLISSHLTSDPEHAKTMAKSISRLMFRAG